VEIDAELQGYEETMRGLEQLVKVQEKALKDCLEWLLRQMVNYVKLHGPWTDRTSNLRNSISGNIKAMQEWPADTPPDVLKAKARELEKPVIEINGDDYTAVLSAGMEYSIDVETASGYWVLQGAIDYFEPLIDKYMSGFLSVENLDLEHIASVQSIKQYGGD